MPTLNELQKRQVIKLEPTKSADYMLVCIQKYDNLSLDDFPNMQPAKRAHIQERLNSMPNPNEQEEWGRLASMLNTPSQELPMRLKATYSIGRARLLAATIWTKRDRWSPA